MGFNDHINFDLDCAIEDIVEEEMLNENSIGYGVAQQVIHSGYDSLTPKQRWRYDKDVVPLLEKRGEEIEVIQRINSWPE